MGARAVGGLGGGSGMLAVALQRTTVTAEASFTSTVFGAASTMKPGATLKPHPPLSAAGAGSAGGGGGSVSGGARASVAGSVSGGARASVAGSVRMEGSGGSLGGPRASSVSFAGSVGGHSRPATGMTSGTGRTGRRPGTSMTSASRAGGRPKLGAEHERVGFSRGLGRAVQVAPVKPTSKAPGTKRLKLEYDELLSSFAFNFNLRRYNWVCRWMPRGAPRRPTPPRWPRAGAYTRPLLSSI